MDISDDTQTQNPYQDRSTAQKRRPYDGLPLTPSMGEAIRLVKVTLDACGQPSCRLIVVQFSISAPQTTFYALSYAWSSGTLQERQSGTNSHLIACNDEDFHVHDNLYRALQRLGRDYADALFWIDTFSIDQEDTQEKSIQVQLMSKIYSEAEHVIVWLGPDYDNDRHLDSACELIRSLSCLSKDERDSIHLDAEGNAVVLDAPKFDLRSRSYWIALAKFFRRSWFTRAWVVQEVILGNSILVLCGAHKLDWDHVQSVSGFLATSAWARVFDGPGFLEVGGSDSRCGGARKIQATKESIDRMRLSKSEETPNIFLESLIRTREYDAGDLRDKVFCCYGISNHTRLRGSYPVPDYDLSVSEAYMQATRAILESTNDLHVLAHAEGRQSENCPGMPSWVPDWSVKSKLGLGITGYRRFYAAATLPHEVEFADPGTKRVLRLRAALVDEIAQIGETKANIHKEGSLRQCQQLLVAIGPVYATGQSTTEAFWRTLIQDTGPGTHCPADLGLSVGFLAWLEEVFASVGDIGRLDSHITKEEDGATAASESGHRNDWVDGNRRSTCHLEVAYKKRMPRNKSSENRPEKLHTRSAYEQCFLQRLHLTILRTTSGLLGSGSAKVQQGDSIWIVPGSRVPLILREKHTFSVRDGEPRYELIGGAYVHGIMHGEALDQIPCRNEEGDLDTTHLRFISVEIE